MDLDSKTLQDLGILGFRSDIANINKEDLSQIGRVNVGQAGQVSKLRGLLGESELNLGEQFKQGTEDFNQQELDRVMKNLGQDYSGFGRDQYLGHQARVLSGDAAYNREILPEQISQRAMQLMRERPDLYGTANSSATLKKGAAIEDFSKAQAAATQELNAARAKEVARLDALRNKYMTEGTEEHKQARQNVYKQLLQSMAQRAKG
jgi:hypothetical protein